LGLNKMDIRLLGVAGHFECKPNGAESIGAESYQVPLGETPACPTRPAPY
jgi:hypothetical protein